MSAHPPIASRPSPLKGGLVKAEYAGALPSRFRRTRSYLGGRADAHYVSTLQFWQLREYARDMERNDPLIRQLVDRAVGNIIQTGMELFPDTGDKALDEELRGRFLDWGRDPRKCDAAGRLAFPEMERMVLAREIIDGDVFALPLDDGTIQIVEGDRIDSPMRMGGDLIHGVKINDAGRPLEYWFIRDRSTARFAHVLYYAWAAEGNVDVRKAVDEDGEPVVLHIFNPQRITQTRGVTAFAPMLDYLGMIEDIQFALIVKQQIASFAAAFIERTTDFQLGARSSETQSDYSTQTIEELSPGMIIRGKPGEKMNMLGSNIPSSESLEHIKSIMRVIGCNLGLPLELVTLDFTATNFSGHRAAIQQAHMGFEIIQDGFPRRFHTPVYRWKAKRWLAEMGRDPSDEKLLRHKWSGRGWPYIEPLTDAQADKMRLDNLLVSPRDLAAERGFSWDDIVRETVEDRGSMIRSAQAAAKSLSSDESPVTWRDVLNLSTPAGVTANQTLADPKQIEAQKDATEQKAKADEATSKQKDATSAKAELSEMIRAAVETSIRGLDRQPVNVTVEAARAPQVLAPITVTATSTPPIVQVNPSTVSVENHTHVAPTPVTVEAHAGTMTLSDERTINVIADVKMPPRGERRATLNVDDDGDL